MKLNTHSCVKTTVYDGRKCPVTWANIRDGQVRNQDKAFPYYMKKSMRL
jgi:hypothetical protein